VDLYTITVVPSINIEKFLEDLQNISHILQLLTVGALLLWVVNIISAILIKIALNKFFKHHYLEDASLKKELGIDTSLTTVSQLLILAQLPGLVFACWFYFSKGREQQNPIIIQCSFTLGASLQSILNSIYYMAKRDVRLRFWVLIKKFPRAFIHNNEDTKTLISKVQ